MRRKIIVYSYYGSPWEMETGDDVRIHLLSKAIGSRACVLSINLSQYTREPVVSNRDGILYISLPRRVYSLLKKILGWRMDYDLNPLIKFTHYLDELLCCKTIAYYAGAYRDSMVYIFGSMSLASFFLRIHGVSNKIVYDPLSNYAQTLYLRSRGSLLGKLLYGLYLALHKLQLSCSDKIVYPSPYDMHNAIRMYGLRDTAIVENPVPLCFNTYSEYLRLRKTRREWSTPYFLLLAGGRGKTNMDAVRLVIETFNNIEPSRFRLYITGPWRDMEGLVRNKSIRLVGVVDLDELKRLIAVSDYGLSPIYSHSSGVFVKTLTYLVNGLDVIASPQSMAGVDKELCRGKHVYVVEKPSMLKSVVEEAIRLYRGSIERAIVTCERLYKRYSVAVLEGLEDLG